MQLFIPNTQWFQFLNKSNVDFTYSSKRHPVQMVIRQTEPTTYSHSTTPVTLRASWLYTYSSTVTQLQDPPV